MQTTTRRAVGALACLCLLLLTGCGSPRVLNTGAEGPWRVTLSSAELTNLHARAAGCELPAGTVAVGFCDHAQREIRLSRGPLAWVIGVSWHEMGHRIEREYPDIWRILDAMDAPGFPCGSDELYAARRAAREAGRK